MFFDSYQNYEEKKIQSEPLTKPKIGWNSTGQANLNICNKCDAK